MLRKDPSEKNGMSRRRFLKYVGTGLAVTATGLPRLAFGQKPIVVGVITSYDYPQGKAVLNAANIAAEEFNAQGGLLGRPLEVKAADDKAAPAQAATAIQDLVERQNADILVGAWSSEVGLAVMPWIAKYKKNLIVTGASTEKLSLRIAENYDQYKYIFRAGPLNSDFIGEGSFDFCKEYLREKLGWKSVVLFGEDVEWNRGLQEFLKSDLEKRTGLKVLDSIRFSRDTTDFTPVFSKMTETKADGIYTLIAHVGVRPVSQWAQQKVSMPMVGLSPQSTDPTFWERTNGACLYQAIVSFGPDIEAPITPKTIPYVKKYLERHKSATYPAFTTYDGMYVLKEAVVKAGSLDPEALIKTLEETDYVGVMGRLQFFKKGEKYPGNNKEYTHDVKFGKDLLYYAAMQWQEGPKRVIIWPDKVKNGDFVYPAWIKKG